MNLKVAVDRVHHLVFHHLVHSYAHMKIIIIDIILATYLRGSDSFKLSVE